ncbi:hypothetical protein QLR68_08775 [Micromonospora sp. DH15]|nr:hypothetical protein [Micromonospora sp. DH15]
MVDTIAPTVASSLRAGRTTLTRLSPLARSSRRDVHSAAELVRYVAHASTTGVTLASASRTDAPPDRGGKRGGRNSQFRPRANRIVANSLITGRAPTGFRQVNV